MLSLALMNMLCIDANRGGSIAMSEARHGFLTERDPKSPECKVSLNAPQKSPLYPQRST